jgi:zinc protease
MDLAFRLEADRMTSLNLSQAGLDAERRNVGAERARRASVLSRGLERLYQMAYNTSPYRWPIYGQPADLSKLTLADAQDFYRQHLGPSNAVITVTGRFDAARRWPPRAGVRAAQGDRRQAGGDPDGQAADRRAARWTVRFTGARCWWRGGCRRGPGCRWPALDLLSVVLGRGSAHGSPRSVVDQPTAARWAAPEPPGRVLDLLLGRSARADSPRWRRRLLGEIGRLTAEPIGEGELERAKRQLETAAWLSIQTSHGRGQALGQSVMLAGDPQDFTRQLERIRACTANDLMRVASLLDPARREVLWISATGAGGQP